MNAATRPYVPERSTAEWQALDAAHYLHPFTDHAALSRKGTRLITRTVGQESGGRAHVQYEPEGLRCVIEMELSGDQEIPILDLSTARQADGGSAL